MKTRNIVIGVAVAAVVLVVVAIIVGAMMGGRAPNWMGSGMMGGLRQPFGMNMFGGGLLALLFGVLVLGGLALLVGHLVRKDETPVRREETPLEIAKRRYAAGEIDREEFDRIKESLLS
jgi:putative membrane protein